MIVSYEYAKLHLVELADIAGNGEIVEITRDGLPSVFLMLSTGSEPEPQNVDSQ